MPTTTDAGRRVPRRDAAANRESLLLAAATTLAEQPDAPLDAIAASAGLSRRAFYGHFANRDELVFALIDTGAARLTQLALDTDHPHAPTAIALLGARLLTALDHVRVLAGIAVREPYIERAATAMRPVREQLDRLIERGIAEQTVRSDIRSTVLARLVEQAAIAVLVEATRSALAGDEAQRLVMLNVLSIIGFDWVAAGALIDATPELTSPSKEIA